MSAFDRGRINYYLENYETAQLDLEEAKMQLRVIPASICI